MCRRVRTKLDQQRMLREFVDANFAEMWRRLARPVILFDEPSPSILLVEEIGEFFRKWRARQDSNLRPPA